jgi:predicted PurR-regulated permease PerM
MFGFDIRAAKIIWTALLIGLLLYVLQSVRSTLLVITAAVFFSYLILPLVTLLQRHTSPRVPRLVIIVIVFIFVIAIAVIAGALFGSRMVDESVKLSQQLPHQLDAATVLNQIPLPGFLAPLKGKIINFVNGFFREGTVQALPLVQHVGTGIMHAATNLIYIVLVPILSFLMIKEAPSIRAEVLSMMGESNSRFWADIAEDLNMLLSHYVRALLLLSLATFTCYSIVFAIFDVPFALLLGGIAALLEVLPFIGPLIAACIILAVALFSGYAHFLGLIIFILVYRIFQDYVLNPYLMSEGVEVSPLLVVIGLLAGEELGGVAGIFLSVPVLAAMKIVVKRVQHRKDAGSVRASPRQEEKEKQRCDEGREKHP